MALWTEIVSPDELTAFSRTAQEALDTSVLAGILPNLYQGEVRFSWRVNQTANDLAEYGEFDTEAPIGEGARSEEKMVRLLPVSRKVRLSEYEQVTDPDRVRQLADDKAESVVRFVINRLNLARGEALVDGGLALNENGLVQNVDFGRAAGQTLATPTTAWGAASADPVEDLRTWADTIADATGVMPTQLIVSSRIARVVAGVLADAGYVNSGVAVSRTVVDEVLASFDLPTLTVFDGRVGGQRIIPDDVALLAPAAGEAGATVFAPTVESQDPRFNLGVGDRSGIVSGLYREDDPPMGWVLGKAVALPILANPDTTLSAKVL